MSGARSLTFPRSRETEDHHGAKQAERSLLSPFSDGCRHRVALESSARIINHPPGTTTFKVTAKAWQSSPGSLTEVESWRAPNWPNPYERAENQSGELSRPAPRDLERPARSIAWFALNIINERGRRTAAAGCSDAHLPRCKDRSAVILSKARRPLRATSKTTTAAQRITLPNYSIRGFIR